ncbi:MAG: hypothetical protein Q8P20_00510 [bacterium]|nr:hypothetical protein [bacterium]
MKIFLASFLEENNFGPGKLIGVANGNQPLNIKCDMVFPPLIPTNDIINNYNEMSTHEPNSASNTFVKSFAAQLDEFTAKVLAVASEAGKSPIEILPFSDGDTLASWEREAFTNYRPLIAACLIKLGFEVIQH